MRQGPFTLSDCESDVANNWVLLVSMQLFTSSDIKHQRKISRSLLQSLSANGPLQRQLNSRRVINCDKCHEMHQRNHVQKLLWAKD